MEKRRLLNILVVLLAVTVVGLFAMLVRPAVTADSVALLQASGMSCGSCAARIEQALKGASGVAAVEVDVERGLVLVGFDGKKARPDAFAGKVSEAGFGCRLFRVLPAAEFVAMAGRLPGQKGKNAGCACCAGKKQ